jgi:hypothetical protein
MKSGNTNNEDTFSYVTKTVIVDSRDRNYALFPNPAKYEIPLEEEFQDVTMLELIGAEVPLASYLVTSKNCQISFSYGPSDVLNNTRSTAYLRTGDYTASDLATEIQRALGASIGDATAVRVSYVPRLDNFEIRGRLKFALHFARLPTQGPIAYETGTAARLMGFGMQSYSSTTDIFTDPVYSEVVTSQYRKDFETDRYAILNIEPAYVNYNPTNNAINKSFAIIPKKGTDMNLCAEHIRTKTFRPPLSKFAKLRISFVDPRGELYDLQNRDHRIELRFTSIRQKKYSQQQLTYAFEGVISDK